MGLFGLLGGLFVAKKTHDILDSDNDSGDGLLEDGLEVGGALIAGKIAKDIIDSVLDEDDSDEDDY